MGFELNLAAITRLAACCTIPLLADTGYGNAVNAYHTTGDVVTMREDGTIRFLERYKDLLKVGGENIDPIEVEGFLLRHPAIDQVQIIGVPDPGLSEVPCACIIPKPGEEVTHEALVAFCRGRLASFKIPQYTVVVARFPMTSSGKVQKFMLREMAAESLGLGQDTTAMVVLQS